MVHKGNVSNFVKFGGETSKNAHDIRKVFLETTLGVYVCFIEFYVFMLDETYVVGPKLDTNIFGVDMSLYESM